MEPCSRGEDVYVIAVLGVEVTLHTTSVLGEVTLHTTSVLGEVTLHTTSVLGEVTLC